MKTYVMLLRGINVGGKNILPMKELTAILKQLGCEQVKTYIQSGNVVFTSSENPADKARHAIEGKYGFRPEILVLDKKTLEKAAENNPFPADEGKAVHFYFAFARPKPDAGKLANLAAGTEQFEIKDLVFYLYAPDGIGRSKLAAKVEACLGVSVTARNLNTVTKLLELAGSL